jgi:hypothetical protein
MSIESGFIADVSVPVSGETRDGYSFRPSSGAVTGCHTCVGICHQKGRHGCHMAFFKPKYAAKDTVADCRAAITVPEAIGLNMPLILEKAMSAGDRTVCQWLLIRAMTGVGEMNIWMKIHGERNN